MTAPHEEKTPAGATLIPVLGFPLARQVTGLTIKRATSRTPGAYEGQPSVRLRTHDRQFLRRSGAYALGEPGKGLEGVRFTGVSTDIGRAFAAHLRGAPPCNMLSRTTLRKDWVRAVQTEGSWPALFILEEADPVQLERLKAHYLGAFRLAGLADLNF